MTNSQRVKPSHAPTNKMDFLNSIDLNQTPTNSLDYDQGPVLLNYLRKLFAGEGFRAIMGCVVTKTGLIVAEDKELCEYLSKDDIRLVQWTWPFIQVDMEGVGYRIFQRKYRWSVPNNSVSDEVQSYSAPHLDPNYLSLMVFSVTRFFEQNKKLKKLFSTKLVKEKSDKYGNMMDLEFDEAKIRAHGRIVMEALGAAIESLNDSDHLTTLLIGIGERHVMYGVVTDMVPLLWPPIIKAFQEQLGSKFTPKVRKAWEHVFQYMGGKVVEGISRWKTRLEARY